MRPPGLVAEVFRLLDDRRVPWVLLSRMCRNMLVLDGGRAMRFLVTEMEALGYRWAYAARRLPLHRRAPAAPAHSVILIASTEGDPREVLFADDAGAPGDAHFKDDVFGFYWTEGLRGLGGLERRRSDAERRLNDRYPVATGHLEFDRSSGSTDCPPAVVDAEQMQGLTRTGPRQPTGFRRKGTRWKLVGNAVTVGVSEWVAGRLVSPGGFHAEVTRTRSR